MKLRKSFWTIPRDWENELAVIIGGGPSVSEADLSLLKGRRVIVINSSYLIFPEADLLFFGDERWQREHALRKEYKEFGGMKVTTAGGVKVKDETVNLLGKSKGKFSSDARFVTFMFSSMVGAMNLAVLRGASKLILAGADCGKVDGRCHHHEPHKWPLSANVWRNQKAEMQMAASELERLKVKVINASPKTTLEFWPVTTLKTALESFDGKRNLSEI